MSGRAPDERPSFLGGVTPPPLAAGAAALELKPAKNDLCALRVFGLGPVLGIPPPPSRCYMTVHGPCM